MILKKITDSVGLFNEDIIIIQNNLLLVADGATGLGRKVTKSSSSDAHWFVNCFKEKIESEPFDPSMTLFIDYLKRVLEETTVLFKKNCVLNDPLPFEIPSFGFSAVVLNSKNEVELYSCGDCAINYTTNDGNLRNFGSTQLKKLDDEVIQKLKDLPSTMNALEKREALLPTLKKNRSKMNMAGGYSVITPDFQSFQCIQMKIISKHLLKSILLSTDGFYSIVDTYKWCSIDDLVKKCSSQNLEEIINQIRVIENNDKTLNSFPRFKISDDASAIYIEF